MPSGCYLSGDRKDADPCRYEAAIEVKEECGYDIVPEIMIPLIGEKKELKFVKDIVVEVAEQVKKRGFDIQYHIGTMIEIPRAALTAGQVAEEAEFFSFGTNDLTQMTFGFSRDDAGKFLDSYYKAPRYQSDPFARLDQTGVGRLVEMAVKEGRAQPVRSLSAVSAASTAEIRLP